MSSAKGIIKNEVASSWTAKFPVMVIAHRGFSGARPENTCSAFKKAVEAGSDMIELDVRLSRDGRVVVIHDPDLERTTDGEGRVADYTLKKLQKFSAGFRFGANFFSEKIPTLKKVLDMIGGQVLVNIEIKNAHLGSYTLGDLADRALQEVQEAGMIDRVIFSSFYPPALERIRGHKTGVRMAMLYHKPWDSVQEVTGGKIFSALNLRRIYLTRGRIDRVHAAGMQVNVYTVNSEEEMKKFIRWGIDGIITNYPDRLLNILRSLFPGGRNLKIAKP